MISDLHFSNSKLLIINKIKTITESKKDKLFFIKCFFVEDRRNLKIYLLIYTPYNSF